jgi:hypothetical protein
MVKLNEFAEQNKKFLSVPSSLSASIKDKQDKNIV